VLLRARSASRRAAEWLGPTLHEYALRWVDAHAGLGHDTVSKPTRKEYGRLLTTFALRHFPLQPQRREAASISNEAQA
jgi:hypothetical protein